jgi:hypothetical protein
MQPANRGARVGLHVAGEHEVVLDERRDAGLLEAFRVVRIAAVVPVLRVPNHEREAVRSSRALRRASH